MKKREMRVYKNIYRKTFKGSLEYIIMKKVYVLLEGGKVDIKDFKFTKQDIIICADGGIKRILNKKIDSKIIYFGDFDSVEKKKIINKKIEIKEYPMDKDTTDGELAIQYACNTFGLNIKKIIIGGVTDRLDHTFGNLLSLIPFIKKGHYFEWKGNRIHSYISKNGKINFSTKRKRKISIISILNSTKEVETKGLRWALKKETIYPYKSRTLRNEAISDKVDIRFKNGILMVIETW